MPRSGPETQLGRVIGERYVVVRWLGEGGHGWVYEAEDRVTSERVAVKVVKPAHASELAQTRLEAEANASRRVDHPGVARILAVGEDGGDAFVAMELVDGPTLRAFRNAGETFSLSTLADVFVPLTDAVAAVHRVGLVHRDLKPSNVGLVLGPTGRPSPKLLDFGMAKAIEGDAHTTTSGRILGTPHYMSPEQALGEPTNDPRVDVWALGVMIYECMDGQRPYGGATATAVLMNILRLPPRPLSQRHRESAIGRVVMRALDRDIDRRFADAGALHDALRLAIAAQAGDGTAVASEPRGLRPIMVALAIALVIALGVLSQTRPSGTARETNASSAQSTPHASPALAENRTPVPAASAPPAPPAADATHAVPDTNRVPNRWPVSGRTRTANVPAPNAPEVTAEDVRAPVEPASAPNEPAEAPGLLRSF